MDIARIFYAQVFQIMKKSCDLIGSICSMVLLITRFSREIPHIFIYIICLCSIYCGSRVSLVRKIPCCKFSSSLWVNTRCGMLNLKAKNITRICFSYIAFCLHLCFSWIPECFNGLYLWNNDWRNQAFIYCEVQWLKAHCVLRIPWRPMQTGISSDNYELPLLHSVGIKIVLFWLKSLEAKVLLECTISSAPHPPAHSLHTTGSLQFNWLEMNHLVYLKF